MIGWIFILVILAILSYLSQVGILFALQIRFPFLTASLINILTLVCFGAVLFRILGRMRKREKENFIKRIQKLEKELQALKAKEK